MVSFLGWFQPRGSAGRLYKAPRHPFLLEVFNLQPFEDTVCTAVLIALHTATGSHEVRQRCSSASSQKSTVCAT